MNLEELKAQIKELDDSIAQKAQELEELRAFRYSIGGAPAPVPVQADPAPNGAIIQPGAVDPRTQWTPEQQALLDQEAARVREHSRFNYGMPRPAVNIQTQRVQLPAGVKPADVLPKEMQDFFKE